jgi:hypothetical protein
MKKIAVLGLMIMAACGQPERGAPADVEARMGLRSGSPNASLAALAVTSVVTDPFWQAEREGVEAYTGRLADLTRSASPIAIGGVVYAHGRAGSYVDCSTVPSTDDCGPALWESVVHQVRAYQGGAGGAVLWTHDSTWRPVPGVYGLVSAYEPLFQFAAYSGSLYVPQANGRVAIVSRATGQVTALAPSPVDGGVGDVDTYVTSPVVADAAGNAWYTVTALQPGSATALRGAWLVRMSPSGAITSRTFADLAPQPASCTWSYDYTPFLPQPYVTPLPWPPAGGVVGPTFGCGAARPQINAAPAVAADGQSVVVVARALRSDYGRLIRVRASDLRTLQDVSLRDLLNDDCGIATPSTALDGQQTATACRVGTATGVDRTTGLRPGARVVDTSTSSPVALPDGGVALGTYSPYRNEQGHLVVINADGSFRWAISFGWLVNATVRTRPGTGLPSYDLVASYSAYDDGPFWVQLLDGATGARRWSYSAGIGASAVQCLSKPGGKTSCASVAGGGAGDFVARRAALTSAGDVITADNGGALVRLSGATGALLSSTPVFTGGVMTDAPIVIDGNKVHLVASGRLYTAQ